jgi:hypothetical protein
MAQLSHEAIALVAEFAKGYASGAQLQRAIKLVEADKAQVSGHTASVASQSDPNKQYLFPATGRCGCQHSTNKDMICVHRLCVDLMVCEMELQRPAAEAAKAQRIAALMQPLEELFN